MDEHEPEVAQELNALKGLVGIAMATDDVAMCKILEGNFTLNALKNFVSRLTVLTFEEVGTPTLEGNLQVICPNQCTDEGGCMVCRAEVTPYTWTFLTMQNHLDFLFYLLERLEHFQGMQDDIKEVWVQKLSGAIGQQTMFLANTKLINEVYFVMCIAMYTEETSWTTHQLKQCLEKAKETLTYRRDLTYEMACDWFKAKIA